MLTWSGFRSGTAAATRLRIARTWPSLRRPPLVAIMIDALTNNINYGWVKNSTGAWLKATTEGVSAAAATAKIPADYRVSITNAPGKDAYPISSFTWLLIPSPPKDANNGKVIKDFLTWMLGQGESEAAALHYAPLPDTVVTRVKATVAQLK